MTNDLNSPIQAHGYVSHTVETVDYFDNAPYMESQIELETLFNKNQKHKRIKQEFDIDLLNEMCISAHMPYEFTLGLVIQMAIHKRTTASVLIGILYHHFSFSDMHDIDQIVVEMEPSQARPIAMQRCAEALEAAIEHDFVDYDVRAGQFIQKLYLTSEVIQELERYQYPLPMIVQPQEIKHNRQNGYVNPIPKDALVILKGQKSGNFYEDRDVCLDHLNRMNQIPLQINTDVVHLIDNQWKDLDRRRRGETYEDYNKRLRAFEKYDRSTKDVVSGITSIRDKFWLTHKYDRRGRVYCQGYHVSYQGNPWSKAMIELANKELIKT